MFRKAYNWWYQPNKTATAPSLTAESDENSSVALKDSLGEFTDRLSTERVRVNSLLNEWMQHKKEVMGHDQPHPEQDHHAQCPLETDDKIKSIVKLFLASIKGYFQSAKAYIDDEIKREVSGHMEPLRQHINELCLQANDQSQSDDARRDTVIHICNASIVMLNELQELVEHVESEIDYCLRSEQRAESAAKVGINVGLAMLSGVVGIMLPPVEFDLSQEYRHFLSDEIQDQKAKLVCDVTEEEGTLKLADNIVEGYTNKLRGSGGFFPNPGMAVGNEAVESEVSVSPASNSL